MSIHTAPPTPRLRRFAAIGAVLLMLPAACAVRYDEAEPAGTPARDVGWIDADAYPFESRFLDVDGGAMHYVDVGPRDAAPVVFVHGTPTWSFLYRHLIQGLDDVARCVAADHIGFGLSAKPAREDFAYTPQAHSENLVALLDRLDLRDVTLVIHDLGGPIGIGAALTRPERIARIVVVNSFAWSLADDERIEDVDGLLQSGLGEWLYLDRNFSPEVLLPGAFADDFDLSDEVKRHYTRPFPNETTRHGLLEIGRALRGQSDWYATLWERHAELAPKIHALVFGLEDEFFGPDAFARWRTRFPEAAAHGLEGVGHFPQEERPESLIRVLRAPYEDGAQSG